MMEYHLNQKVYIDEIEEVAKLNEDCLADNPYKSKMNIDNYPTHRYTDPQTGETHEYCAASKYFQLVDPKMSDRRSLHYAGEDKVYLILKNKFTKEWEFPTGYIKFGQTFLRAKQNIFTSFAKDWRIKYYQNAPLIHTLREFSKAEKEDKMNLNMKGVRTYYF